jgi:hypothetical protein
MFLSLPGLKNVQREVRGPFNAQKTRKYWFDFIPSAPSFADTEIV